MKYILISLYLFILCFTIKSFYVSQAWIHTWNQPVLSIRVKLKETAGAFDWARTHNWQASTNGPLPISRVASLDQLLPLSLGSSSWFSYEDRNDFLSNKCSILTRFLHFYPIVHKSTVIQYLANIWFSRKIIVPIVIL